MANQQNDGLDDERLVLRVRSLSFPARIKTMDFYSHVVLYTAKGYIGYSLSVLTSQNYVHPTVKLRHLFET